MRLLLLALPAVWAGSFAGQVVDDASGVAVVDAEVTVLRSSGGSPTATARTDARGRFRTPDIPAGSYDIQVRHAAHVLVMRYAPRIAGSGVIVIPTIRLALAGVAAGRVVNNAGDPVQGAFVALLSAGKTVHFGVAVTDEQGMFRLDGVAPGDYYVLAVQKNSLDEVAAPTLYPSARGKTEAVPIVIRAGEEQGDIRIRMRTARAVTVSGRIQGPIPANAVLALSLVPADGLRLPAFDIKSRAVENYGSARRRGPGEFRFPNVPEGSQYELSVWRADGDFLVHIESVRGRADGVGELTILYDGRGPAGR